MPTKLKNSLSHIYANWKSDTRKARGGLDVRKDIGSRDIICTWNIGSADWYDDTLRSFENELIDAIGVTIILRHSLFRNHDNDLLSRQTWREAFISWLHKWKLQDFT